MSGTPTRAARGRVAVLELVKRESPVTADTLAAKLGVTGMAVRQHLEILEDAGFVEHEIHAAKRGRPSKLWRTTKKAESCFADSHAAFAVELIAQIREAFGEESLDRLVTLRTAQQERAYATQVTEGKTLKSRLEKIARLRTKEGYMAEIRKDGPDSWLLLEHHCPICSAARVCTSLCREELKLFQRILGKDARVERVSHILAGAARCAYRVTTT